MMQAMQAAQQVHGVHGAPELGSHMEYGGILAKLVVDSWTHYAITLSHHPNYKNKPCQS